ncbi:MAG: zinc ribbon domain-containing protein [bacterium]|nr:zinc ribbon domain-containing protein [bacterium]
MAVYEYICRNCGKRREVHASISEKEKGLKISCEACGSPDMDRLFSPLAVRDSTRSRKEEPSCPNQGDCRKCVEK